jgi:hypothetical protein
MTHTLRPRHQNGQASVETAGLAVLVALLFAALAAWAPGAIRLPAAPPPVFERLGAVLGVSSPPLEAVSTTNPLIWNLADNGNGDEPIGNFLRRVRDVSVRTGTVTGIFAWSFANGVKDGATAEVVHIVHDPIGTIIEMVPDPNPITAVRNSVQDAKALAAYLDELRSLPPEEAARRLGRDTGQYVGAAAVDSLIKRSIRASGRRAVRHVRTSGDRTDATESRTVGRP